LNSFPQNVKIKLLSLLFLMSLLFTGCSSIVDGRAQHVKINSHPTGATFSIYDKEGKAVTTNTAPANLVLNRRHGYFNGEDYKIIFAAPGYYPYEVHVKSTVDGWYFGNILFGGLIGFIIVDPATGAMYTLKPDTLDVHLVSNAVALTPEELNVAEINANLPPVKVKPVSSPKSDGNK
jgi:hypothetical protein